MAIKASTLIGLLAEHIEMYGDNHVLIYDDYESVYRSFDKSSISRNEGKFVIECNED